jgi:diamine N-acetyltransferase
MVISIRKASTVETPLIAGLAKRIWREHYIPMIGEAQVEYMLDRYYTDASLQTQMAEGQVFWLPDLNGEVIGYVAISPKGPGEYFLNKFYIDNEKRGMGFGKVILERVLAQYPDLRQLRLTVNRRNYKTINFYFRVGFTIEGCFDFDIGNGYEMNDFIMVLKLGGKEEHPTP